MSGQIINAINVDQDIFNKKKIFFYENALDIIESKDLQNKYSYIDVLESRSKDKKKIPPEDKRLLKIFNSNKNLEEPKSRNNSINEFNNFRFDQFQIKRKLKIKTNQNSNNQSLQDNHLINSMNNSNETLQIKKIFLKNSNDNIYKSFEISLDRKIKRYIQMKKHANKHSDEIITKNNSQSFKKNDTSGDILNLTKYNKKLEDEIKKYNKSAHYEYEYYKNNLNLFNNINAKSISNQMQPSTHMPNKQNLNCLQSKRTTNSKSYSKEEVEKNKCINKYNYTYNNSNLSKFQLIRIENEKPVSTINKIIKLNKFKIIGDKKVLKVPNKFYEKNEISDELFKSQNVSISKNLKEVYKIKNSREITKDNYFKKLSQLPRQKFAGKNKILKEIEKSFTKVENDNIEVKNKLIRIRKEVHNLSHYINPRFFVPLEN